MYNGKILNELRMFVTQDGDRKKRTGFIKAWPCTYSRTGTFTWSILFSAGKVDRHGDSMSLFWQFRKLRAESFIVVDAVGILGGTILCWTGLSCPWKDIWHPGRHPLIASSTSSHWDNPKHPSVWAGWRVVPLPVEKEWISFGDEIWPSVSLTSSSPFFPHCLAHHPFRTVLQNISEYVKSIGPFLTLFQNDCSMAHFR